jgi:predicted DNA binding CopG/RHH family protein
LRRFAFYDTPKTMTQDKKVTPKKRGRPATGKDPHITVRLPVRLREKVDAFASANGLKRSEAIRQLIEHGLAKSE